MKISIIAALSKNFVIGNKGRIPWHISEDFKYFKKLTLGHTVIMGEATFKSIGKPLPDRKIIVMSKDKNFEAYGCVVVHSLEDALKLINTESGEIFIAGGGQIYKLFLSLADKLYLTEIDKAFEGDTYFPRFDKTKYKRKEILESEENGLKYSFNVYNKV
ncbi:dihydrofolate reductase [Candidatus Woesebacteria bacterium]|nr:MAG: dihydrofolate reductase [Candidatus Woesebacteria bacterium]